MVDEPVVCYTSVAGRQPCAITLMVAATDGHKQNKRVGPRGNLPQRRFKGSRSTCFNDVEAVLRYQGRGLDHSCTAGGDQALPLRLRLLPSSPPTLQPLFSTFNSAASHTSHPPSTLSTHHFAPPRRHGWTSFPLHITCTASIRSSALPLFRVYLTERPRS